jgi:hypothetical protein
MRQYECICLACKTKTQIAFPSEPYPELEEVFSARCAVCDTESPHKRVLTKKAAAELRRQEAEQELRQSIIDKCTELGFACRFWYQSVIITTPLCDWCFDYHQSHITLYHESAIKINFKTGNYANSHAQFRDKKMSPLEVIDYISAHDQWRIKENQSTPMRNSE